MPASQTNLTLTDVRGWDTAHLTHAAGSWERTAIEWEQAFTDLSRGVGSPGGVSWAGETAESAQQQAHSDQLTVATYADQLQRASDIARRGADRLSSAKSEVLGAVAAAEDSGFTVDDDFSISSTESGSEAYLAARQAEAEEHATEIRRRLISLVGLDQKIAGEISAAAQSLGAGFGDDSTSGDQNSPRIQLVDNETVVGEDGLTPQPGQPVDPRNPFIGDLRFGHWEDVIPPPYTGADPPPLEEQYRPFPPGTPAKNGGPTEWYTPGRTWVNDLDAPLVTRQEQYKFRIAGQEATTFTRMVDDNGVMRQQRWVQNVYEAQHNTMWKAGGEVPMKGGGGKTGDIAGLPAVPNFGDWHRMAPNEIASLSAVNPTVSFYIPDGCGGQFTYENGFPVGGFSGLPANPVPIMTAPR